MESTYPNANEIERADKLQLARWYRFLPSPKDSNEITLLNRIIDKFKAEGGFDPELSKQVGW